MAKIKVKPGTMGSAKLPGDAFPGTRKPPSVASIIEVDQWGRPRRAFDEQGSDSERIEWIHVRHPL